MDLGDLTFLAGLVQQPIIVEGTPTWVWVASGIAAVLTGISANLLNSYQNLQKYQPLFS